MPTMTKPVLMPQMGESIAEGTIVRWIKKVGDTVDCDEPLFEISTDKVDAEIPSPAAGVLSEIKVKEGETVAVNSVVATIGDSVAAAKMQPDGEDSRGLGFSRRLKPRRHEGKARGRDSTPGWKRRGGARAGGRPCARDRRRSCAGLPKSTTSTSRRCTARASPAA